jgi:hypothetical protein
VYISKNIQIFLVLTIDLDIIVDGNLQRKFIAASLSSWWALDWLDQFLASSKTYFRSLFNLSKLRIDLCTGCEWIRRGETLVLPRNQRRLVSLWDLSSSGHTFRFVDRLDPALSLLVRMLWPRNRLAVQVIKV